MSRMEKFGSRSRTLRADSNGEAAAEVQAEEGAIPSRRKTHPSNKGKMTTWFYRVLTVLFILLLGGLLLWGRHNSGELQIP